jgi:hypothetical protein
VVDENGRTVAVQKYGLQPATSGKQAIPPILIEYVDRRPGQRQAPEGGDAYELLTERMDFEVQSVLPADAEADLKPPRGPLPRRPRLERRVWPWVCAAILLVALAAVVALRHFRAMRLQARRQSAYEIARSRLDRLLARPSPTAEQIDAFYVELSGIVRQYLEDRFELRAPELTTEEFLASVGESPDLSGEHQALLRRFLRQADLVKFAQVRPQAEDVARSIEAAGRFLEETKESDPRADRGHRRNVTRQPADRPM